MLSVTLLYSLLGTEEVCISLLLGCATETGFWPVRCVQLLCILLLGLNLKKKKPKQQKIFCINPQIRLLLLW